MNLGSHVDKRRGIPDWNNRREEDQESEYVYVPQASEPIQRDKHKRECKRDSTEDLGFSQPTAKMFIAYTPLPAY
jgi:hypothetical protein